MCEWNLGVNSTVSLDTSLRSTCSYLHPSMFGRKEPQAKRTHLFCISRLAEINWLPTLINHFSRWFWEVRAWVNMPYQHQSLSKDSCKSSGGRSSKASCNISRIPRRELVSKRAIKPSVSFSRCRKKTSVSWRKSSCFKPPKFRSKASKKKINFFSPWNKFT